jgi:hypothetical protein
VAVERPIIRTEQGQIRDRAGQHLAGYQVRDRGIADVRGQAVEVGAAEKSLGPGKGSLKLSPQFRMNLGKIECCQQIPAEASFNLSGDLDRVDCHAEVPSSGALLTFWT